MRGESDSLRNEAEHVAAIWNALENAETWQEFIRLLPPGEWEEIQDEQDGEIPIEGEFDADEVPGYSDGNYPTWLQARMEEVLPSAVLEKYGERAETTNTGMTVDLNWSDAESIADELRSLGHSVELREDLSLN